MTDNSYTRYVANRLSTIIGSMVSRKPCTLERPQARGAALVAGVVNSITTEQGSGSSWIVTFNDGRQRHVYAD